MSLRGRLLKNGVATILQRSVRVLDQLLLVPFFISSWGAAYYGEWLTLTIIPSVLAFSDLGFGTAAANNFVLSYAGGQEKKAADISKTGFYVITILILIALLVSTVTLLMLDYFNIFDKTLLDPKEAIIAVSILIFARLLNFYSQLIESYFIASQRAALRINLLTVKASLSLGFGLIVLLLGFGIVEFALSQLLVTIFFNIFFWKKGRQVIGLFQRYNGEIDKSLINGITKTGLGFLMFSGWQIIYFQGTTFAVRVVLGAEAVAIFNTVRALSRTVNQLLYVISASIFPELQYEIGKGNVGESQKIFRFSMLLSFFLAISGAVILAIFGLWFYEIWTHNELQVPPVMWYVFVVGIVFHAFWWSSETVFKAKNDPYKFAFIGVGSALISVVLTYVFSGLFGLIGAAIGAVALDVIMAGMITPIGLSLLDLTMSDIWVHGWKDMKRVYFSIRTKLNF